MGFSEVFRVGIEATPVEGDKSAKGIVGPPSTDKLAPLAKALPLRPLRGLASDRAYAPLRPGRIRPLRVGHSVLER